MATMKLISLLLLAGLGILGRAAPAQDVASGSAAAAAFSPTLPPHPATTAPPETVASSRFAMLDDVRLLANGLLQLGQSLREFVHKTKAQINDIFNKLNIFDRSFYQLSVVTSEIKEEEEELKKTTTYLKANNEEIRNLSLEINSKINNILQERTQLQSQVGGLEEKLKGLSQGMLPADQLSEIHSLKEVIESQERTITELLKAVGEQHDQLNHQKNKIKSLEDKLGDNDDFQDTIEKGTELEQKGGASLFDYLTGNSTGLDTSSLPADCSELFDRGQRSSGIYPIKPNQSEPFNVYCEMTSEGGSTVIQRREDGAVDFDQPWEKYESGFGDLEREFWLGLRKIQALAEQGDTILHIELEDWKDARRSADYQFNLGGPATQYTIQLTHLSGDLPDALANHTGMRFSTKDHDNDNHRDANCARSYTGGWWFNACGDANLNGRYMWLRSKGRTLRRKGIHWRPGMGGSYALKSTKISVRPAAVAIGFH